MSDQSKVASGSVAPGLPVTHCISTGYTEMCVFNLAKAADNLEKITGSDIDCSTIVSVTSRITEFTLVCKVSSAHLLKLLEGQKKK